MNTVIKNIKQRPKQFILCVGIPCLWPLLLLWDNIKIESFIIIGIGMSIIVFVNFNMNASHEVLGEELNQIIKKHGVSKEHLFEITGLTKYEVTEKDHQFEFHVSPGRKKKYLNMLKEYYE
ncbi:hypothetical protein JJL48_13550 [Mammaliicoccus sciuri]|nr:hypothetical protein JJL48_13550 [Mammaliicoccus sciuri]